MVTYCVTKIEQFFDTMIIALSLVNSDMMLLAVRLVYSWSKVISEFK